MRQVFPGKQSTFDQVFVKCVTMDNAKDELSLGKLDPSSLAGEIPS